MQQGPFQERTSPPCPFPVARASCISTTQRPRRMGRRKKAHINEALAKLPADATPVEKANAVGSRPLALPAPRGAADDLQRIKGVGPVNEKHLHELGVFHFDQIAAWTRAEIRWIGTYLAFPGRIDREQWPAQAARLAHGDAGSKDGKVHTHLDETTGR